MNFNPNPQHPAPGWGNHPQHQAPGQAYYPQHQAPGYPPQAHGYPPQAQGYQPQAPPQAYYPQPPAPGQGYPPQPQGYQPQPPGYQTRSPPAGSAHRGPRQGSAAAQGGPRRQGGAAAQGGPPAARTGNKIPCKFGKKCNRPDYSCKNLHPGQEGYNAAKAWADSTPCRLENSDNGCTNDLCVFHHRVPKIAATKATKGPKGPRAAAKVPKAITATAQAPAPAEGLDDIEAVQKHLERLLAQKAAAAQTAKAEAEAKAKAAADQTAKAEAEAKAKAAAAQAAAQRKTDVKTVTWGDMAELTQLREENAKLRAALNKKDTLNIDLRNLNTELEARCRHLDGLFEQFMQNSQ